MEKNIQAEARECSQVESVWHVWQNGLTTEGGHRDEDRDVSKVIQ